MTSVGVFDAKNRLTALIEEVEHGGREIVITRRGKPVAKLVAANGRSNSAQALEAAQRIRAASKGRILGDVPLRTLIEEGRR